MQEKIAGSVEVSEEKRMELANYIRELKDKRHLGFNQLALKSNLNVRSLTDILNGNIKKINPFLLKNLAVALKISYLDLYKIIGYIDDEDITQNNKLSIVELEEEIPIYSKIQTKSDGTLEYGKVLEYITIPRLRNGTEIIGVKVNEDSMEYIIPKGATILVEKDTEVQDNEIGIFIYQNNLLIKRIKRKDGVTVLLSDNHKYDPIVILDKEEFFAVGKVVEVMYKL